MAPDQRHKSVPELLAPAGTLDVFEAAIDAGADAVYVGAPYLNARALARQFSTGDIVAMSGYARERGVRLYLAANSLVKESELPMAVEMLALAEALKIDALIVQDLGLARLARQHFPGLRLHASTLLGAHNSDAIAHFARGGFSRVVLARELTLAEIGSIIERTGAEVEVFVHGALCFAYSGLCMFSSYQGGKSGLRGRCVQPCRRRFSWTGQVRGGRDGYFFSMQDLAGLDAVNELRKIGVASLKIEGRMRSIHYVHSVVRAYRLAIDARGEDREAYREAAALLGQAMGRGRSEGYFRQANPIEVLAASHSGNIGDFLGRFTGGKGSRLELRRSLQIGDRLRLHREKSGERQPFTLKEMRVGKLTVNKARKGERVEIAVPFPVQAGDSLYRVDLRESRQLERRFGAVRALRPEKNPVSRLRPRIEEVLSNLRAGKGERGGRIDPGRPAAWWIKIADPDLLPAVRTFGPQRMVFLLDETTMPAFVRRSRQFHSLVKTLVLALPPVIEEAALPDFRVTVRQLAGQGFIDWQISHVSQIELFSGLNCKVSGNYTLNVLNSLTVDELAERGISPVIFSVEADRAAINDVCRAGRGGGLGVIAYGTVPLFTARPAARHFLYERVLLTPRQERFLLRRQAGLTMLLPDGPFSLLPWLEELAGAGIGFVVADLSHMRLRRQQAAVLLRGFPAALKSEKGLPSFNYRGELL